jgi:hypothetical protein
VIAWFIDALDAKAGHCFASRRWADLADEELDLDLPALFVGPPAFRPEALASRALAFAAARGSAQLGFFLDGAEIGFPTLDSLVEFVRRAYLAGSAGDAPGGGGGAPPDLPPDRPRGEGPDTIEPGPDPKRGEGSDTRILLSEVRRLGRTVSELRLHESSQETEDVGRPAEPPEEKARLTDAKPFRAELGHLGKGRLDALARAGEILLTELLLRVPGPSATGQARWNRAMSRLGFAMWALGVENRVASPTLVRAAHEAQDTNPRLFGYLENDPKYLFSLLAPFPGARRIYGRAGDRVDCLSSWPLPAGLADAAGLPPKLATLRSLLCGVVADPVLLLRSVSRPFAPDDLACLVLLAAAWLTASEWDGFGPAYYLPERRSAIMESAGSWLEAQLPGQLFAPDVEAAIRSCTGLSYSGQTSYAASV